MASGALTVTGSNLGNSLQALLMADDIVPGALPSYQLCKTIYSVHPLGLKMVETPIAIAQSQEREITIPKGPETRLREQFVAQWRADGCDKHIFNAMRLARMYGISALALLVEGKPTNVALDYKALAKASISFNVYDPLNTSGSLILSQNPTSMEFLKTTNIRVGNDVFHSSRAVITLNEDPLYIEYTVSAFGYVGRSVYQRALFPLKSFIQTMVTDDMVSRKAGLLVAMMKQAGSIVDNVMSFLAGVKRALLQEAQTNNVISVGADDKVESLNLQNLDGAATMARRNIIENIATAADMPAKLLLQETFAEGFGEGTEDAKHVAKYVDRERVKMAPLYEFMDRLTQYRAWNEEFYGVIQKEFPDTYAGVPYNTAFYDWVNSFQAAWPSLLTEPDSEKIKVDDVKLKAVIAMIEVLLPAMDPDNRVKLIEWAAENFNELKLLFGSPLDLDYEALADFVPPDPLQEPAEPKPFAATDSQQKARVKRALDRYDASVATVVNSIVAQAPRRRPNKELHS
jgi:hypothetical protein